jgi:hypothetical protein
MAFPCADDGSADAEAVHMAEGREAELWKAGRLIVRLPPEGPKKSPAGKRG